MQKKSGFKKALEAAGLVEFSEQAVKKEEKLEEVSKSTVSTPLASPTIVSKPTATDVDLAKFIDHFNNLLDKANLPGPDYFEFSQVFEQLKTKLDEKTAITAAFASLSIQGLSKETIINSASSYIQIIQKDKSGFQKALKEKIQAETSSRDAKILQLQNEIDDNTKQIQRLTKLVSDSELSIQNLKNEMNEAVSQLQKNEGGFAIACDSFAENIQSTVNKVQQYL
jgi:hypothetical protein